MSPALGQVFKWASQLVWYFRRAAHFVFFNLAVLLVVLKAGCRIVVNMCCTGRGVHKKQKAGDLWNCPISQWITSYVFGHDTFTLVIPFQPAVLWNQVEIMSSHFQANKSYNEVNNFLYTYRTVIVRCFTWFHLLEISWEIHVSINNKSPDKLFDFKCKSK